MFTDMVGYTALGQKDESLSLALVEEQRRVVRPILARHNGREVKTIGDAFLVEFPSAVDAVRCAYDIQRAVREFNLSFPSDKRIHLRVGVHVGEVIESEGDISGDAVNVASRIEPLAEDGGVCLTRQVHDFVRNRVDIPMVSLGSKFLKNVVEPLEVYRMIMPWEKEGQYGLGQPSDKRRLAVLPFANMSPDPNDEYFADGMTEELIDRLAQIKEIEVIARTSVMSYKGEKKKAAEIAKELGVGSLVEGSVRKAGNRVRVTAQLINGATEGHLWSSHFDGYLDDIFAVQSEIAEKVAGELKIRLLETERRILERKPTENTEAYGDFLRGRELLRGEASEATLRQALALLEKAVELDPSFARARVEVAECHIALADMYEPKKIAHSDARASLKEALNLDPDLPEAHSSLASLLFNEDDLMGAETEAIRALELNPSLPDPHRILFEIAATRNDPVGMVSHIETAYRLDPIKPLNIYLLGEAYFWTGKDGEALEHWKKTESVSPAYTYRGMADYYFTKGDLAMAGEYHAKVQKILPEHPWVIWMEGALAARLSDRDKALLSIKRLEGDAKVGPVVLNYIAYVDVALGDLDSYFARMEEALEARAQIQSFMMYAPFLAKVREDPRYQQLVQKLRRQTGLAK
ncbi:MAG TPA: adenylate/guanylate cyclase domain-containing protein [Nitrososphaerales archaeon]|nr:adenylate/guanylate cyclase domain-containing protein [Nitrososphaerales archaeon]